MNRQFFARMAGITFLLYIAATLFGSQLFDQAINAEGIEAKLVGIAQHEASVHVSNLLALFTIVNALVLAVSLYAITRETNHDLAMIAMCCRLIEAAINAVYLLVTLGLLSIATGAIGTDGTALASLLFKVRTWSSIIGATTFAVGSTVFSYLFLRARNIPALLSWYGLCASMILVVTLPLQLVGLIRGSAEWFMWMPMLLFEVILALWLIIKGVAVPTQISRPSEWQN